MAQRSIIKAEFAFQDVLKFEPQKLSAVNFENLERMSQNLDKSPDFQIAEVVRSFTGLAEIEGQRIESEIEKKALEQLQSIQEQAYAEAYALGLNEGQERAFTEKAREIDEKLENLERLLSSMRDLKLHFLNNNENQIMKMVLFLSTKIAMFEISERPNEAIKEVLRKCIRATHEEEKLQIIVAPEQIDFLESLQKEKKRDLEFLKNVEFAPEEGLLPGGCKITTNFSDIDARLEERIKMLWDEVLQTIPPLKDQLQNG